MEREKRDCYKLGTFYFEIRHMGEISFPPFLERYRVSETARSSHVFELRLTDDLPQPKGTQIAHRADIDVYKVNGLDAGGALAFTCRGAERSGLYFFCC